MLFRSAGAAVACTLRSLAPDPMLLPAASRVDYLLLGILQLTKMLIVYLKYLRNRCMLELELCRFAPLRQFLSCLAVSLFLGFLREFQLRFVPPGAPLHQSLRRSAYIFSSL